MSSGDVRWFLHRAWHRVMRRRCFGCEPDLSMYPLTVAAFAERP